MDIPDLQHLSTENRQLIISAADKVPVAKRPGETYWKALEVLAETLDQVGLHQEGRHHYEEIISASSTDLTKARCWRKTASSFISQRLYDQAAAAIGNALAIIRTFDLTQKEALHEYFKIHIEAGFVYYFLYQPDTIATLVAEMRLHRHRIEDPAMKMSFLHVVGLSLLNRYRWYKMPEEALTHAEYFLEHARQSGNPLTIVMALCHSAFSHLWNEDITDARRIFMEVLSVLQEKNFNPLLMAYNYIAVSYRMQNNISMTEQWANLTLEKAQQTANYSYVSYAHANLSWVCAKRHNWLYAEDYARKAEEGWNSPPLFYSYSFIRMECLLQKGNLEEAGKYAYMLVHPKAKKLPDVLEQTLRTAAACWIKEDKNELHARLTEAVTEAKISGYY